MDYRIAAFSTPGRATVLTRAVATLRERHPGAAFTVVALRGDAQPREPGVQCKSRVCPMCWATVSSRLRPDSRNSSWIGRHGAIGSGHLSYTGIAGLQRYQVFGMTGNGSSSVIRRSGRAMTSWVREQALEQSVHANTNAAHARLLHHAVVIQIEGASYRLRQHAELIPEHVRANTPISLPPPPKRRGRPPKK